MMERLIDTMCILVSIAEEQLPRKYFEELDNDSATIIGCLEELKMYRDLEEQGLLHKAPLKNGTPIWYFTYGFDEGTYLINTSYLFGVTEYEVGELGKDFWLSEEEAEAKLKELQKQ